MAVRSRAMENMAVTGTAAMQHAKKSMLERAWRGTGRVVLGTVMLAGWMLCSAEDVPQHLPLMNPAEAQPSPLTPGMFVSDGAGNGVTISIPNGYVNIAVTDLRLQSVAGEVRWTRIWDGQEWKFNSHWESLSQSWKNLTGSQTADTTGGVLSSAAQPASGSGDCWVWVDEDWQAAASGTTANGQPDAGAMVAARTTPFNRAMGEVAGDYLAPQRVSVDSASLCVGTGASGMIEAEGIRRINELYLGEAGRYTFSNRTVLEKRAVRELPATSPTTPYAGLDSGRIPLSLQTIPKGYRWTERAGDWIDYNTQGQVVAYGDRNDNTVWLVRDTQGVLRGIVDAQGRVLATLHYTGLLVTEVRDYPVAGLDQDLPARSVKYQYDARNRLTEVTDVRGHATRYEYNTANRIVRIFDANDHAEQLAYNGPVVARRTAADGGVTDYVFEFDDVNKQFISKITGPETPAGRRVEDFTHNRVGKLVRRIVNGRIEEEVRYDTGARIEINTNVRGLTTRTTKDEFEQIVETAYADGSVRKRRYSAQHLELSEETDEAGVKTQYQRDSKGNLLKKIEAVGAPEERITEYTRNSLGQVTQITYKGRTEVNGTVTPDATWQIEYDLQGQISKTTDPEGHVRQAGYNRAGHLVSSTDPRGHTTRYEVDALGHLTQANDALGRVRGYAYDKVGNLLTQTDARGKATQAAYDAMNRLVQTTSAVGGMASMRFNRQGLMDQEIDEDGRINRIEHDNFLRISRQVDALDNATQFSYQIADSGNAGSVTDPTEIAYPTFTQQIRYDERERPTHQVLKHSNSRGPETLDSATAYDRRGFVQSETDANGNTRTHNHDALGQRIETTDALGGKTTSAYDTRGNLLQLTDANGHKYGFQYDRNNRVLRQTLPLRQIMQFSYDAAGNLDQKIDPRGNKTRHTYDAANRLTEIRQTSADGSLLRLTIQTWDDNDNLVAWSDTDTTRPTGQQITRGTATYDDANRKTGETVSYPTPRGDTYTLGYGYAYSLAGKKTRLTWPDGTAIAYGYTQHGELETVSIPGEGTISVNQYRWTVPEEVTLPGGSTQNKTYDGLLNLEGFKVKTPAQQSVLELENQYGKVQELKSRSRTDTLGVVSSTRVDTYQYDADMRLRQVGGSEAESFTLDAVGNRTAHSRQEGDWTYDANNRLIRRGSGDCGTGGTVCYEWDEAGNLIRKTESGRVMQYAYDTMNRLTEVKDGADELIARYGYNPQDRRLWKEQYRDKDGQALAPALRTYYLYADEGLIGEATQAIVLNADRGVMSAAEPAITTQYGPRPESEFTTGMLFIKTRDSNGQDLIGYYHHDHLGTPIQVTDKAGRVVWAAEYKAFGRAQITRGAETVDRPTIPSNIRLPGQYEDEEIGLHYNLRRYYDPEGGRYISEDQIGLSGGVNMYGYAGANPINNYDATGEMAALAPIAIPALIMGARLALMRGIRACLKNPKCKCSVIHTAYKAVCKVGCKGKGCVELTVKEKAMQLCQLWRQMYMNMNCDRYYPKNRADHPEAQRQAKVAWEKCRVKRDAACACAGS